MRKYLTQDDVEELVYMSLLLPAWIYRVTTLLNGLPNNHTSRVTRLQNIAAKIVTRTNSREHTTLVLRGLH